MNEQRAK